MCLIVNNPNPQTSKENIVCYKVLNVENEVDSEDKRYVTPYRNFEPYFCTVLTAKGQCKARPDYGDCRKFYIDEGAFHSFENIDDARKEAYRLMCELKEFFNPAIVKCIIPAGTPYYKGFYDSDVSYASKEIIFSEIVSEFIQ